MDLGQILTDFLLAISPALQTALQAILVLLAGQVSAWLYKTYQSKRAELGRTEQYLLDIVVDRAVSAAEQLYTDGEEKLAYATNNVEVTLKSYGIVLELDVIRAAIEATVRENL